MAKFRPMLAATIKGEDDLKKLANFPYIAQPKLDGIRVILTPDGAVTRTMKPIRNKHIQKCFLEVIEKYPELVWSDGEIMAGDTFSETTNAVMSFEGVPETTFWIFDNANQPEFGWCSRFEIIDNLIDKNAKRLCGCCTYESVLEFNNLRVKTLESDEVDNIQEILNLENQYLRMKYEGLMLRDPTKPYKFGRASMKSQNLMKLKQFTDNEAVIIGFEELMHNNNEATLDAFGLKKRSSCKENLVGGNTLGKLVVRAINGEFNGVEFGIGTGFTDAMRDDIWANRDSCLGRIITFKHQLFGAKDAPRINSFLRFRGIFTVYDFNDIESEDWSENFSEDLE